MHAVLIPPTDSNVNVSQDSLEHIVKTTSTTVLRTICAKTMELVSMVFRISPVLANLDSLEAGSSVNHPSKITFIFSIFIQ